MIEKHIEAVLRSSRWGKSTFIREDGTRLVSNGHFATKWSEDFGATDYPGLGETWIKALSVAPNPSPVGGLCGASKFFRRLRLNTIKEAYFRCFAGEGITWTETGKEKMVYVHRGSELIALVMPVKHPDETPIASASDADVFEEFACEANNYYCVGQKALRKEIDQLVEDLEAKEDRITELESECSQLEKEIDRKRGYLANLRTPAEAR